MGGSTLYVEAARVDAGEGKGNLRTTGMSPGQHTTPASSSMTDPLWLNTRLHSVGRTRHASDTGNVVGMLAPGM